MTAKPISELMKYPLEERLMLIESEAARLQEGARSDNLKDLIGTLHRSEIADVIERLPAEKRIIIWLRIESADLAEIASDLPDSSLSDLVEATPDDVMIAAMRSDASIDDKAALLRVVSAERRDALINKAGLASNLELSSSLSYEPDAVGSLMDFEHVVVNADMTVAQARQMLEDRGDLPAHADKLFVVDQHSVLCGILPLKRLLIARPSEAISARMVSERLHTLTPETDMSEAANLFERYDLVSVPVLDAKGQVRGRLTIDEIVSHLSEDQHVDMLNAVGVNEDYDLYAPLGRRLRQRGVWMLLNLLAAFLVSRIIGSFEDTIAELVILAALMPIVSSLAGSTAMQTASVMIRALALEHVTASNTFALLGRELKHGLVSGLVWGALVGGFGYAVYGKADLAAVLLMSQLLVFVLGAAIGFCVPLLVGAMRGDPALGTAVLVTAATDSLSFLIFLGLATLLLI